MKAKKRVEYVPPSRQEIFDYSKSVCEAMNIKDSDTIWGLANFIEVIARVTAQSKTKQANEDIRDENE
jgi:hypothetical protein